MHKQQYYCGHAAFLLLKSTRVIQGWKAKSPYTFCSTVRCTSASQQEKENKKGSNKKPY